MKRENRKTQNERPAQNIAPELRNYRIPRLSERENNNSTRHSSPNRDSAHSSRSRHRAHSSHRRRQSSPSPRRPSRDISLARVRRRAELRRRPSPQVQFREHIEFIPRPSSPHHHDRPRSSRHRSPSRRRYSLDRRHQPIRRQSTEARRPIAERLGPNPGNNPLVRVVHQHRTQVLKFAKVPRDVSLSEFLKLLSRWMTGVTGASREFNYTTERPGDAIYIYAVIQEEIDAAVNRELEFNFSSGMMSIKPSLQSATIMSVMIADAEGEGISLVPTLMLRNLISITTRQAIAGVIDAVDTVANEGTIVTHVRVPTKDSGLHKTAAIAFVGISSDAQLFSLDGFLCERLVKNIPLDKSLQAPVLIPTAMSRQPHDKEWAKQAAKANMLVLSSPFKQ